MKKIIAGVIGLSLLGAGMTAFAAPAPVNQPQQNGGYNRAPVFQSALTTATPGEALKKMSADAPAVSKDGKQYFVRASVRDMNGNTLYQSSLSTATPKEALTKMAGDAPAAASGQQYYVRAGIMEILPVNNTAQ